MRPDKGYYAVQGTCKIRGAGDHVGKLVRGKIAG